MMLLADLIGTTVLYGVHHGQKCHRSVCLWIDHSLSRVINHPGRQLHHIMSKTTCGLLTNRSPSKEKQVLGVCTWNHSASSQIRSVWTCTASTHPQAPHENKSSRLQILSCSHLWGAGQYLLSRWENWSGWDNVTVHESVTILRQINHSKRHSGFNKCHHMGAKTRARKRKMLVHSRPIRG